MRVDLSCLRVGWASFFHKTWQHDFRGIVTNGFFVTIALCGLWICPTFGQNVAPFRDGQNAIIKFVPDAQSRFDPAADNGFVQTRGNKERLSKQYPLSTKRLSEALLHVMDTYESEGKVFALSLVQAAGGDVLEDRITVLVSLKEGADQNAIAQTIIGAGGLIVRLQSDHIKARVPASALRTLAETVPSVQSIRLPEKPSLHNTTISEGKGLMNATAWHAAGYRGAGVKVAIIDGGFIGLAARKAADEIPASAISVDETGTGMEAGTEHGCAVAEIVYDLAPDAQLYLIKVGDSSDLVAAKDYCKANGITIVNHSMGWTGFNFFDGQAYSSMAPSPVTVVNDANANNILWVNSAGNDQHAHALAPWRDDNADNYMDWTNNYNNVNQIGYHQAGAFINVFLLWNQWPTTSSDYDFYLVRYTGSSWALVSSSEYSQTGTQPPIENVWSNAPYATYYGVVVSKYSSTTSPTFIVRYPNGYVQYSGYGIGAAGPGSIGSPADASSAFAVGAITYSSYATGPIASYSSQGPNNYAYTGGSALIKPDICGPAGTASVTYPSGFNGTSASSPHLAAVAALVKCAYPSYTAAQIRSFLETRAIDMGPAGKDSSYGWGRSVLGKVAPAITTWPTASAITYGQALSASTLSGGLASVAGSFAFTTPSTIPSAGTASQSVTFTPTDTVNYDSVVGSVSVTVNKKALTVTGLTGTSRLYNGTTTATAAGTAALSGVISPDAVTLSGTPVYTFASKNVGAGIAITTTGYTLSGAQAGNYSLTQPALSANITAKALTVTATGPANKPYGTALATGTSSVNFSATATGVGSETVTSVTLTPNAAGTNPKAAVGTSYVVTPSLATGTGGFLASNYSIIYNAYTGTVIETYTPPPNSTPWSWLDLYGLVTGTNYAAAAGSDTDGDGLTAAQEYIAGTVPTNVASVFKSSVVKSGGQLRLQWMPDLTGAVPARVYSVYGKSGLASGFSVVSNNIPAGVTVPVQSLTPNKFFKAGVTIP